VGGYPCLARVCQPPPPPAPPSRSASPHFVKFKRFGVQFLISLKKFLLLFLFSVADFFFSDEDFYRYRLFVDVFIFMPFLTNVILWKTMSVPYILAYKLRNFGQKLELFCLFDLYTGGKKTDSFWGHSWIFYRCQLFN
jgi:hypothetical protein